MDESVEVVAIRRLADGPGRAVASRGPVDTDASHFPSGEYAKLVTSSAWRSRSEPTRAMASIGSGAASGSVNLGMSGSALTVGPATRGELPVPGAYCAGSAA